VVAIAVEGQFTEGRIAIKLVDWQHLDVDKKTERDRSVID